MQIQELFNRLMEVPDEPFKVGDIIMWKPGLKERRSPEYDQPVIITAVLEPPIIEVEKDAGSAYFGIAYDIKIGVIRKDEFLEFHMDSRRFQKVEK